MRGSSINKMMVVVAVLVSAGLGFLICSDHNVLGGVLSLAGLIVMVNKTNGG